MPTPPESYVIPPTPHVPNSRLPILVYRNALPDTSPDGILSLIEPNKWIKGGQWKPSPISTGAAHFHSNTHECYAVISGKTKYLLGRGPLDGEVNEEGRPNGMLLNVGKGDVFVLPAGVSHCAVDPDDDYEFVGLYPEGLPKWDMNMCKASAEETAEKTRGAEQVPIPEHDPVYGLDGYLPQAWTSAAIRE